MCRGYVTYIRSTCGKVFEAITRPPIARRRSGLETGQAIDVFAQPKAA
ncbi:MAG TPA: hypothetical protein VF445_13930 [Bordetella sp.]